MYEMYPEAWAASEARRQHQNPTDRPRRRTRKEHSVTPVALAQHVGPEKPRPLTAP